MTSQAGAIGLALFATALGLMTAIPLVFSHVLFKDWIVRFEMQMKAAAQKLLVLVQNTRRPARREPAAPMRERQARPASVPAELRPSEPHGEGRRASTSGSSRRHASTAACRTTC